MALANIEPTEEYFSRKEKLFYYSTNLLLVHELMEAFHSVLDNTQVFNKVLQGTPIPQHRILFFIERLNCKSRSHKWAHFFKFLLRHYTIYEIGDLLYQGFYYADLQQYYLNIAKQKGHSFLWPQGKNIISPHCHLPGPLQT